MVAVSVIGNSNVLREASAVFAKARRFSGGSPTSIRYVAAQEAAISRTLDIRVPNDLERLEITISNNPYGQGVVVASLGPGNAAQAGLLVGDVISEVNGVAVSTHEMALEMMSQAQCAELRLTMVAKARKVTIDKRLEGMLEITLTTPSKGAGVEVESVGYMGLAAAKGVVAGHVVLAINGTLVSNHAEAIAIMDTSERWIELVLATNGADDEEDSSDCGRF